MCPHSEMPANRETGATTTFNRIVRLQIAINPGEVNESLAPLPASIKGGLMSELSAGNEAHRYDLKGRRAYYFQCEGDVLNIWSWNEVESYMEAGNLLTLIVKQTQGLSEEQANDVYLRATGRSVSQRRVAPGDK
jgi:hypothetical protein